MIVRILVDTKGLSMWKEEIDKLYVLLVMVVFIVVLPFARYFPDPAAIQQFAMQGAIGAECALLALLKQKSNG